MNRIIPGVYPAVGQENLTPNRTRIVACRLKQALNRLRVSHGVGIEKEEPIATCPFGAQVGSGCVADISTWINNRGIDFGAGEVSAVVHDDDLLELDRLRPDGRDSASGRCRVGVGDNYGTHGNHRPVTLVGTRVTLSGRHASSKQRRLAHNPRYCMNRARTKEETTVRRVAVIPAFNESETVGDVVASLRDERPDFDILVVDDGSTDNTAEAAEAAGARVVRLPFNLGIGGAVQAGFTFAHENGYDQMVQVDGDGQHEPAEIEKLLDAMDKDPGTDVVCGSRFATDTGYVAPISRRTGIHIFAFLLSHLVGQPVTDPTSGFRLYNRHAIKVFANDYPHDYPEVEAVLMLHHHQLQMSEVSVAMYQRGAGRSSIGGSGKSAYYMVKVLLALMIGLVRKRPEQPAGETAGEPKTIPSA